VLTRAVLLRAVAESVQPVADLWLKLKAMQRPAVFAHAVTLATATDNSAVDSSACRFRQRRDGGALAGNGGGGGADEGGDRAGGADMLTVQYAKALADDGIPARALVRRAQARSVREFSWLRGGSGR